MQKCSALKWVIISSPVNCVPNDKIIVPVSRRDVAPCCRSLAEPDAVFSFLYYNLKGCRKEHIY